MAKKQKLGTVQRVNATTARVQVDRMLRHPIYLKAYRTSKSFLVHVPTTVTIKPGDQVMIEEMRPVSKRKAWQVVALAEALSKPAGRRRVEPQSSSAFQGEQ